MSVVIKYERHAEPESAFAGEIPIRNGMKSPQTSPSTEHSPKERITNGVQEGRLAAHVLAVYDGDTMSRWKLQHLTLGKRAKPLNLEALELKHQITPFDSSATLSAACTAFNASLSASAFCASARTAGSTKDPSRSG